ncbi:MAG: Two component system histidine kinase [Gammaproteobacteria bacterium]|nr:Two component system histidine kinase [Gammaproteobacteria bacterium]
MAVLPQDPFNRDAATQKKSHTAVKVEEELVIDWEDCLRRFSGDEETVRMLLSMLSEDLLINTMPVLEKSYPARDIKALRAELHRSIGGVCSFSLPRLHRTLKEFQTAVKAEPSDFDEWERAYDSLKSAIVEFQEIYKNGNY